MAKRLLKVTRNCAVMAVSLIACGIFGSIPAIAQEGSDGIVLTAPITGIRVETSIGRPTGYNLDITIDNRSSAVVAAQIRVVSGPSGWNAGLLHRVKEVFVNKIELAPGEENSALRFHFDVPKGVDDGTYEFRVGMFNDQDDMLSFLDYRVVVAIVIPPELAALAAQELPQDVKLDPQYTHLTGLVGTIFTFRVNLKNRTSEELELNLAALPPLGWNYNFRPAFQSEQIGAITLRPNSNQDIDIRVTPPGNALPGVYSVTIGAGSKEVEPATASLTAELVGVPTLVLGTIDQNNEVTVKAGEPAEFKVLLVNSGTGPATNVALGSLAPEDWNVTFDQNPIAIISPKEALEITMTIDSASDTQAGDYNVDLKSSIEESVAEFRFRVTVERSSVFGFLGVAVIVFLVVGLGALTLRLRR